jgi:hypothetical protein
VPIVGVTIVVSVPETVILVITPAVELPVWEAGTSRVRVTVMVPVPEATVVITLLAGLAVSPTGTSVEEGEVVV